MSPALAHILLWAVTAAGFVVFAFSRRRFDLCSLAFFSAVFYFLPGLLGFVAYAEGVLLRPVPVATGTYLVMAAVVLIIVATGLLQARREAAFVSTSRPQSTPDLRFTAEFATLAGVAGAALTVFTVGAALWDADKFALLQQLNRWHLVWTSGATLGFVVSALRGARVLAAVNLVLLLFNLWIGFRVELVIAVVAAATITLHGLDDGPLVRHWKIGVAVVGLALFMYLFKYLMIAIQLFDVDLVLSLMQNPDALRLTFLHSENFVIQGTLNEVVRSEFFVGPDHLKSCLYLLVMFPESLGANIVGFNDLFQPALFSTVTEYGMASNIWAEMYSVGGWPVLAVWLLVFAGVLALGNRLFNLRSAELQGLAAVVMVYWAFYIHRNDLVYQLTLSRRVALAWLLFAACSVLMAVVMKTGLQCWRQRTGGA